MKFFDWFRKKKNEDDNKSIISFDGEDINKILIVDDLSSNRDVLYKFIQLVMVVDCDFAKNGKEALELCNKNTYKIILLDIKMPVIDGIECITLLRKHGYKGKIISVSAYDVSTSPCAKLFDDHLRKPVNMHQLRNILNMMYLD